MKHIIIGILVLAAACSSPSKPSGYGSGRDTTRTIVIYSYSPIENQYKTSSAVRFSYDTIMPDPADKTKNIPQRDTFYNVRILEKVLDSLGHPIKTVNGRDSMTPENSQWQTLGKRAIIHDFNYNFIPAYNAQVEQIRTAAKR